MARVQELCRRLKPVMGRRIDRLWSAYLAESDAGGKADIEQMLELLAVKHLGADYNIDRSPFPPPTRTFAGSGDIKVGAVSYAKRKMYPFYLKSPRLKEHILIAGRSGSGKTNLTFVLMDGIMDQGIKVGVPGPDGSASQAESPHYRQGYRAVSVQSADTAAWL